MKKEEKELEDEVDDDDEKVLFKMDTPLQSLKGLDAAISKMNKALKEPRVTIKPLTVPKESVSNQISSFFDDFIVAKAMKDLSPAPIGINITFLKYFCKLQLSFIRTGRYKIRIP